MVPETTTGPESQFQNMSDEDVYDLYRREGNINAFNEIVFRYERQVLHHLRSMLGTRADLAEDVWQETLRRIVIYHDKFDSNRKFRAWIYTIASNAARRLMVADQRHDHVNLNQNRVGEEARDALTDTSFTVASRQIELRSAVVEAI